MENKSSTNTQYTAVFKVLLLLDSLPAFLVSPLFLLPLSVPPLPTKYPDDTLLPYSTAYSTTIPKALAQMQSESESSERQRWGCRAELSEKFQFECSESVLKVSWPFLHGDALCLPP